MPNTRVIDYTVLVQNKVMSVEDVPEDIRAEVTKWLEYFQAPAKKAEADHEQHD